MQSLLLSLLLGLVGWALVWLFEDDEKQKHREGICPHEWEAKRERVKANTSDAWERAERKLFGIRSGIEQRVRGEKK